MYSRLLLQRLKQLPILRLSQLEGMLPTAVISASSVIGMCCLIHASRAGFAPLVASKLIHPDIQTAQRLAEVLGVPAPYLYAEDELLAVWILAYSRVTPAVRKKITRTVLESSTA